MASNQLPDGQGSLWGLAHDMKDGATSHGAAIGLVHHTAATLGAALTLAESTQGVYKTADKAMSDAGIALRLADSNGKGFIATVHGALTPKLGKNFSPEWAEVGFKNNSLAVPGTQDDRLALLNSMNLYFIAHPAMEINDPTHNLVVTAVAAKAFWQAIITGRSGVNTTQEDYLTKKTARDNADQSLRDEMSGMVTELGDLLDDLDPGWLWFGLNQPGAVTSADPVANLAVTAIARGFLAVWPHAANANLYHLEIQIIGTDADFRRVATTSELSASQTGLPAAATVDVRVLSVSANGTEAAPSNVVRIVTGN
jgi:hypothetical protein